MRLRQGSIPCINSRMGKVSFFSAYENIMTFSATYQFPYGKGKGGNVMLYDVAYVGKENVSIPVWER